MSKSRFLIVVSIFLVCACEPRLDELKPVNSKLEFNSMLALGSSLCAGYSDDGISADRQENSLIALLLQQMKPDSVFEFSRPVYESNYDNGRVHLITIDALECDKRWSKVALQFDRLTPNPPVNLFADGPFDDLCVAELLLQETGTPLSALKNLHLRRLLSASDPNADFLDLLKNRSAQFITYSFGSAEIYRYIRFGGQTIDGQLVDLSDPSTFIDQYRSVLEVQLDEQSITRAVIFNLPDLSEAPFLSHISTLIKASKTCETIDFSASIEQRGGSTRKFTQADRILLTALQEFGGFDSLLHRVATDPLQVIPDYLVLDSAEFQALINWTHEVNIGITALAADFEIPVVDFWSVYSQLPVGTIIHGREIDNRYIEGLFYSKDGIFPTQLGLKMLVNSVLTTLNLEYGVKYERFEIVD